jgi:PAS domain S-box-containing protein
LPDRSTAAGETERQERRGERTDSTWKSLAGAAQRQRSRRSEEKGPSDIENAMALLRHVLDRLPHHICVRDREGRFVLANRALAESYGVTPDRLEGRTEAELAAVRDRVRPPAWDDEPAAAVEETFTDADGAARTLSTVRVPFQTGSRHAVLGISVDITERKRDREKERRLAAAVEAAARDWRDTFDSMSAALMVLNLDGVVLRANRVAADWLGVHVSSLPGQQWAEFARQEPWRRAAELVKACCALGRGGGAEVRDAESGTAWEIRVDPARHGGDATVILSIRDVSEMVEVREWARRNESLAALGSVVAGVAHEVRNPMAAIAAHVEALALQNGALSPQDESLVALRSEVKRLSQLVTELLEYGRPRQQDLETLEVADVIRSAIEACQPMAAQQDVGVHLEPAAVPPVLGDSSRLRRVFVNLIQNALQHSPIGTTVGITLRSVAHPHGTLVLCRVVDAGSGFTPTELAHAFEPFYTRRRGGTGLGLPIVRRILSDHGGSVEAGNRPEGGAFVLVSLPAKESA